ncbi:unnamed protein product [Porites evermanni]|uniref:Uncharacterized protein n=1 Tax=Porites evermanni TaxID=104178 RepID=A0ABN8QC80_9CNID|nr:unnamed protein product [Porites evermanni]
MASIKVGDCDIQPLKHVRNLGTWFDNHMSMNTHIGKVSPEKASRDICWIGSSDCLFFPFFKRWNTVCKNYQILRAGANSELLLRVKTKQTTYYLR